MKLNNQKTLYSVQRFKAIYFASKSNTVTASSENQWFQGHENVYVDFIESQLVLHSWTNKW